MVLSHLTATIPYCQINPIKSQNISGFIWDHLFIRQTDYVMCVWFRKYQINTDKRVFFPNIFSAWVNQMHSPTFKRLKSTGQSSGTTTEKSLFTVIDYVTFNQEADGAQWHSQKTRWKIWGKPQAPMPSHQASFGPGKACEVIVDRDEHLGKNGIFQILGRA